MTAKFECGPHLDSSWLHELPEESSRPFPEPSRQSCLSAYSGGAGSLVTRLLTNSNPNGSPLVRRRDDRVRRTEFAHADQARRGFFHCSTIAIIRRALHRLRTITGLLIFQGFQQVVGIGGCGSDSRRLHHAPRCTGLHDAALRHIFQGFQGRGLQNEGDCKRVHPRERRGSYRGMVAW